MFIKKGQATARLSDPRNRLRDSAFKIDPETGKTPEELHAERLYEQMHPKPQHEPPSSSDDLPPTDPDSKIQDALLDSLDEFINAPANPGRRVRYAGQRENQLAIGETSLILGAKAAAPIFGLKEDMAEAYENGRMGWEGTSHGKVIPELYAALKKSKERIAEKAASRIEKTLDALSDERLGRVKRAVDIAKIGKDMAVILDKVSPKDAGGDGGTHFHIFVPEIKQENHYQTIELHSSSPNSNSIKKD